MEWVLTAGTLLCLGGIVSVLYIAFRQRNIPALVNALVSASLVLLSFLFDSIARRIYGIDPGLSPELSFWIAVAGVAHSYGMLGPYDDIWWWDHLTHTVSAALIAALVHAAVLVSFDHLGIVVGAGPIWAVVVSLTLLAGVFWELVELLARDFGRQFDVPPVLDHYGRRDTIVDLFFDVVGALFVLLFDVRIFVPMAETVPDATVTVLVWGLGLLVVGSLVVSLIVVVEQAEPE